MNGRLILAAILSVIGAVIIALIVGSSVYTFILLPAFIIVLIVNICGGQTARAVWLGFLLFFIVTPLPSILTVFFSPLLGSRGPVILLNLLIIIIAFILVLTVFFPRQNTARSPNRRLALLAGIFILLAAIFLIAEKVRFIVIFYNASEQVREHSQLNWPMIILSTSFQVVIAIGISALLFLRERFTFYIITPIYLVLNLLLAFDKIFHFMNDHVSTGEIMRYLTTPFRIGTGIIYLVNDIYALLTLIIVVYFLRSYTNTSDKDTSPPYRTLPKIKEVKK